MYLRKGNANNIGFVNYNLIHMIFAVMTMKETQLM